MKKISLALALLVTMPLRAQRRPRHPFGKSSSFSVSDHDTRELNWSEVLLQALWAKS
jgi:hypothetical protein